LGLKIVPDCYNS